MRDFLKEFNIEARKTPPDHKASLNGCTIPGEEIYKILEVGTTCKARVFISFEADDTRGWEVRE